MTNTTRTIGHRHTLTDITRQVLRPAGWGRWSFYTVIHEMADGCTSTAPPVNTIHQATSRALDWFPQVETVVREDTR